MGDPRRERPPAVYGHVINVPTRFNVPIRPSDERPPAMYGHFCLVPRVSVHDRYYCTLIVLMVSQIILNSTCSPAMKIYLKLETATYAPTLKLVCLRMRPRLSWHVCLRHDYLFIIYIFISCNVYRIFFSHHVIAYAHVYYSLMFNNVILHMLKFIIHLCL